MLANVLLGCQPWTEGSCKLGSACPSVCLSVHPSVCCSCLFRSLSFLGIYTLVFSDILKENLVWAK